MLRKIILGSVVSISVAAVAFLVIYGHFISGPAGRVLPIISGNTPLREVIGFLPYWLLTKADSDYAQYLTTLDYFSLTINKDGTIQRLTSPIESEPGYLALKGGKLDPFLKSAKDHGLALSLTVYSGNGENINEFLKDPKTSADNLSRDVIPIMKDYGFTDLNLDVEQVADASPEARLRFTRFAKKIKENLVASAAGTLSVDISAIAFVRDKNLADPTALAALADKIILMAYDYHSTASLVTGPVAPAKGAGIAAEFDAESAVAAALKIMPPAKLILGIPLYGYEWETITDTLHSAVIPGTSLIISNRRAEDFLADCATCSATFNTTDEESAVVYKNPSGTYQQIAFPDKNSTQYKVDFAQKYSLGGIALWALGYEGKTILSPLAAYRH